MECKLIADGNCIRGIPWASSNCSSNMHAERLVMMQGVCVCVMQVCSRAGRQMASVPIAGRISYCQIALHRTSLGCQEYTHLL